MILALSLHEFLLFGIKPEELREALNQLEWIDNVKELPVWSLDGEYNILTADLLVSPSLSLPELESLKEEARQAMSKLKVHHCTFEFSVPNGH